MAADGHAAEVAQPAVEAFCGSAQPASRTAIPGMDRDFRPGETPPLYTGDFAATLPEEQPLEFLSAALGRCHKRDAVTRL